MISSFKGKRKLSAFFLTGNTGQDGLRWQDQEKFGGGNDDFGMSMEDDGTMNFEWRGGTSDDEAYLDPQNGFITNVNAGAHYGNKWNDKHNLNISPKYNSQDYNNHKQTYTQTLIKDSILNENSDNVTHINRRNFRNRIVYDIKLDSNNSLKLTANANFYDTESDEIRTAVNTGANGILKNTSYRKLLTNGDKSAFSGNLIFRHRFKKLKRTLSASADWNTLSNDGTNFLESSNQAYLAGILAGKQDLNQMKEYNRTTNNISAKFVYTEPLNKEYSLEVGYQLAYNFGNNDQLTYSFSPVSGKYDFAVDSLSNRFKQDIIQHIPSAKINFTNKKFKINVGSGFGLTDFQLRDITVGKDYNRNYVNFFPAANITYTYKPNRSIRLNYNGNTRQPTIDQLQPLRNNNDYFNQYIGNPDLKPSFFNQFNIQHHTYNFIKDIFMHQFLSVRLVSNSITQSRTINVDSGKIVTQPINTNGNVSVNLYTGGGFKLKKLDMRVYLGPNFNYYRYADVINGERNFTRNISTGLSVNLQKGKEKKYDVSVGNEFSYNNNTTTGAGSKVHFYTNRLSFNGIIYYKKTLSLTTDYTYFVRQKVAQASSIKNHFWNARLERTFKNNEFAVYFDVRDILNQNIGIDRNFSGNTFTEVRNDRLKRFFFVGFRWDFKNKGAATK